jgi:receptor protein-tyrosine kinase
MAYQRTRGNCEGTGMTSALRQKAHVLVETDGAEQQVGGEYVVEIRSRPDRPLIIDPDQRAAHEHFGILRARLLKARSNSGTRCFLITSPQRQDGKSYTSANLAISLAQLREERVLLVDGDLRLRGLTKMLELEQQSGLADVLKRTSSFEESVKVTTLSNLFVVPAGDVQEDSLPALLQGSDWPNFMEMAKRQFGLIVVDSVPVSAPIADFELLLNGCDAALLVVQMRHTTREAIDFSAQRLQHKLLGAVVNRTESGTRSDYSEYATKKST